MAQDLRVDVGAPVASHEFEEFVDLAIHDLKEPLRKILAFSEYLERDAGDALPEKAREDISYITDGARRMAQLLGGLGDYADVARLEMVVGDVDLDDALDDALRPLDGEIAARNARIDRAALPTVKGDRRLIQLVFRHLIANAIRFTIGAPRVQIRTLETRTGACIEVRDSGVGIAPSHHRVIFAPFKRLEGRRSQGSGIGLSICKRAVERHGGSIWVESEIGEGARFRFTLDASSAQDLLSEPNEMRADRADA